MRRSVPTSAAIIIVVLTALMCAGTAYGNPLAARAAAAASTKITNDVMKAVEPKISEMVARAALPPAAKAELEARLNESARRIVKQQVDGMMGGRLPNPVALANQVVNELTKIADEMIKTAMSSAAHGVGAAATSGARPAAVGATPSGGSHQPSAIGGGGVGVGTSSTGVAPARAQAAPRLPPPPYYRKQTDRAGLVFYVPFSGTPQPGQTIYVKQAADPKSGPFVYITAVIVPPPAAPPAPELPPPPRYIARTDAEGKKIYELFNETPQPGQTIYVVRESEPGSGQFAYVPITISMPELPKPNLLPPPYYTARTTADGKKIYELFNETPQPGQTLYVVRETEPGSGQFAYVSAIDPTPKPPEPSAPPLPPPPHYIMRKNAAGQNILVPFNGEPQPGQWIYLTQDSKPDNERFLYMVAVTIPQPPPPPPPTVHREPPRFQEPRHSYAAPRHHSHAGHTFYDDGEEYTQGTRAGLRLAWNLAYTDVIIYDASGRQFRSDGFGHGFEFGIVTNTAMSQRWSFISGGILIFRGPVNSDSLNYRLREAALAAPVLFRVSGVNRQFAAFSELGLQFDIAMSDIANRNWFDMAIKYGAGLYLGPNVELAFSRTWGTVDFVNVPAYQRRGKKLSQEAISLTIMFKGR